MIKFYRNEETKAIVVALQGEACPGMKELVANTTDAAQEKHVPVVTRENGKVAKSRAVAAPTFDPSGLYLTGVEYPSQLELPVGGLSPFVF